jgi:hypothetical protein
MIYVFNNGASEFVLPEGFAFPFNTKYAMLQVHYKRMVATASDSFLDSTGLSFNWHWWPSGQDIKSVQFFELGPRLANMLSIPPRTNRHAVQSICAPQCLSAAMEGHGVQEFRIIAVQQHMHLTGIAMKSEVLHANGSSTPFGVFPSYNMSEQEMRLLPSDVIVSRGDALKVTCVYDSSQRTRWTFLGESLSDEMCFSYILMAPAVPNFNHCWHVGSVSSARAECNSECSKPFSVQPTHHFQGPEAAAAEHDVFSATGACLST